MQELNHKPRVGFILGDQAGIGPEIVLKLLHRPHFYDRCEPLLIGNFALLQRLADQMYPACYMRKFEPEEIQEGWDEFRAGGIPVVNIDGDIQHVIIGMLTNESGWITYRSIETGYHLLEKGVLDGLIIAPCTKEAISKSGCGFHSEYEILEHCAGVPEVQTVVKGGAMHRISAVGHVAFRQIAEELSEEKIIHVARSLASTVRSITGEEPRLLVAALNPDEEGIYGDEEREIILPAVEALQKEGICIEGPFQADTLLNRASVEGYNGIVYMYHDQGNIAMKSQMFQSTACIYTNIPYPILSTGHGSALDIAELGIANPTNISYVLSVITEMINNKRQQLQHAQ